MRYDKRDEEGKFKKGKYSAGKIILIFFIVLIIIGGIVENKINKEVEVEAPTVVQKTTDDELERIMNDADFKAITILRARKVASDSKMKKENEKHESIINEEKTRHDAILAQIEAENEAIRAEELALVGSVNLK